MSVHLSLHLPWFYQNISTTIKRVALTFVPPLHKTTDIFLNVLQTRLLLMVTLSQLLIKACHPFACWCICQPLQPVQHLRGNLSQRSRALAWPVPTHWVPLCAHIHNSWRTAVRLKLMRAEAAAIMDFFSLFLSLAVCPSTSWWSHRWIRVGQSVSSSPEKQSPPKFTTTSPGTAKSTLRPKRWFLSYEEHVNYTRVASTSPAPKIRATVHTKASNYDLSACRDMLLSLLLFLEILSCVSTAEGRSTGLCALIQPLWHCRATAAVIRSRHSNQQPWCFPGPSSCIIDTRAHFLAQLKVRPCVCLCLTLAMSRYRDGPRQRSCTSS